MVRLTLDEFINRSKSIHGDKYDYKSCVYVNNTTKVKILCKKCGEYFWQEPKGHLNGWGCQKCARKLVGQLNKKDESDFIEQATKIHQRKYDYSKVKYITCSSKVDVICPKHGIFQITPSSHLEGCGCPKCANEKKRERAWSQEEFIKKCHERHGDKYNYDETVYVNSRTKINVICPKHGLITVHPLDFLKKGCSLCLKDNRKHIQRKRKKYIVKSKKEKKQKQDYLVNERKHSFIEKSKQIHNGKYDYSKVEYKNTNTKVCIICPEHGEFWQTPVNHVKNHGCPQCAWKKTQLATVKPIEKVLEDFRSVHGNKYDYSQIEYVNGTTPIKIICPKHGEFWQRPVMHFCEKQGCPSCGCLSSKEEIEILGLLKSWLGDTSIENRNKSILHGKEIDIFIPSLSLGIEYNGLRWHSENFGKDKNYHLNKLNLCNQQGIKLFSIFSDEYKDKKDIILAKLKHLCHLDYDKQVVYGRKCNIKIIDYQTSKDFLNANHIQGAAIASIYLGAYDSNNTLVGVMTFIKRKNNQYELNRCGTRIDMRCIGVCGKLFHYFLSNFSYDEIVSFADRRFTLNKEKNLYTELGFSMGKILEPDYKYYCKKYYGERRVHKFNFRKNTLSKKYGFSKEMTELEMAKKLGAAKIWDCGLIKYIYKNN